MQVSCPQVANSGVQPSVVAWLDDHAPALLEFIRRLAAPAPHKVPGWSRSIALPLAQIRPVLASLDPSLLPRKIQESVDSRRLSYLGGRLSAELCLEALGSGRHGIGMHESGAPVWPSGFVGSITHTADMACSVAGHHEAGWSVGIDSEVIPDPSGIDAIRSVCCTHRENLQWLGGSDTARLSTCIFSAKEALYKALHPIVGRYVDFSEVEVRAMDCEGGSMLLCASDDSTLHGVLHPTTAWIMGADRTVHAYVGLPLNSSSPATAA